MHSSPTPPDLTFAQVLEHRPSEIAEERVGGLAERVYEGVLFGHKLFTMLEVPGHREGAPLAWLTHNASLCADDATPRWVDAYHRLKDHNKAKTVLVAVNGAAKTPAARVINPFAANAVSSVAAHLAASLS